MRCPLCNFKGSDSKVLDSRLVDEGSKIRRRRECLRCNERFVTFEEHELFMPRVVKNDDRRETFNEEKLRTGMFKALEKRKVSADEVEAAIDNIKKAIRNSGEREIPSRYIGNMIMDCLFQLDKVAYVRFASVYHRFQSVDEFQDAVNQVQQNKPEDYYPAD